MRILWLVLIAQGTLTAAVPANNVLPLFFIPNQGQAPPEVAFMAKGSGMTVHFSADRAVFRVGEAYVQARFTGASPLVVIEGRRVLPGHANFLTGAAPEWRADVPLYGEILYRELYPGIDMAYGGEGRELKSEFRVAPGASPERIQVHYTGGSRRLDAEGALIVQVEGREFREQAPVAYQEHRGGRKAVDCRFSVAADGTVSFIVSHYDRRLPLVIDPVLSYSTLLGGSGAEAATAVAVDVEGAAYIAGYTASYDFPATAAAQNYNAGGVDAFVAKMNASGTALVYCTYLGGSGDDRAYGIAVGADGSAFVAGTTTSTNFPTRYAEQSKLAGGRDAFLTKLSPTGVALTYSTYFGGSGTDIANGVAVDASGYAYVVGDTNSLNFPASGFQRSTRGGQDAFLAKFGADGTRLVYSTYFGGNNDDHGTAIAVDTSANVYVTGSTWSSDFPVANAAQSKLAGGQDAFVARLSADGNELLFGTYLGGTGGTIAYPEAGQSIALDEDGNAYVAGTTASADFPLVNAAQSARRGALDAFVAKVSASGTLAYSTYLGGTSVDYGNAIAVDANGSAYVGGYVYSTDLAVSEALQSTNAGECDAFLARLSATGNTILHLSYFGGNGGDTISALAVDSKNNLYAVGWTLSSNFPMVNGLQTTNAGLYGAFLTKISFKSVEQPTDTNLALGKSATQSSAGLAAAGKAVDGNTSGAWSGGSVTHTDPEKNAWWQVDLGSAATVSSMVIWNRTDCCSDRLGDYWVFVSNTPFSASETPSTLEQRADTWSSHQTSAPSPSITISAGGAQGRYVRVQLSGTNPLSLAEVQVFGTLLSTPSSTNIALGKSARQSSAGLAAAGKAVDGNTSGAWGGGSVTHTDPERNAWWQVDLGSTATVTSIVIWNRTDCCGDRLGDYWVFVSNTPFSASETPSTLEQRADTWSSHQTSAPSPSITISAGGVQGRYVRVQLSGTNPLSLAEVQVFGTLLSTPSSTNIALGMSAAQSSYGLGGAERAVDGNTSGAWGGGSVTHTDPEKNAWWQVDLGSTATVTSIVIWNRTDCCSDRLGDYWVFVSNTPFSTSETPATLEQRADTWSSHQTSAPSPSTTISTGGAQGRYVRVQLSGTNPLSLAEVQVF